MASRYDLLGMQRLAPPRPSEVLPERQLLRPQMTVRGPLSAWNVYRGHAINPNEFCAIRVNIIDLTRLQRMT